LAAPTAISQRRCPYHEGHRQKCWPDALPGELFKKQSTLGMGTKLLLLVGLLLIRRHLFSHSHSKDCGYYMEAWWLYSPRFYGLSSKLDVVYRRPIVTVTILKRGAARYFLMESEHCQGDIRFSNGGCFAYVLDGYTRRRYFLIECHSVLVWLSIDLDTLEI
jgi:hypothetical protein